jgi:hypothetical protein
MGRQSNRKQGGYDAVKRVLAVRESESGSETAQAVTGI